MRKFIKELPWNTIALAFLGFLFVLALAFSVVFESLLPLWRAGDTEMLWRNLIGIPLIFIGLGFFIWSALRFLWDFLELFNGAEFDARNKGQNEGQQGENQRSSRSVRWVLMLKTWRPSFLLFVLAFSLMAVGGWLIN